LSCPRKWGQFFLNLSCWGGTRGISSISNPHKIFKWKLYNLHNKIFS
jgi:hypothetical protein